jgi:hypothetical protein
MNGFEASIWAIRERCVPLFGEAWRGRDNIR